jgi:hypothetical protein
MRNTGKAKPPNKGMSIFIAVLLIPAGLALSYVLFVKPVMGVVHARHWTETPCLITDSYVGRSHGRHGTSYRVDVEFSYAVDGARYSSSNYQFDKGYSSGYVLKKVIVDQYMPGQKSVCYVNPANPAEAVMMRDFTPGLLFGLTPLAFSAAGFAILRSSSRRAAPSAPTPRQNAIVFGIFALVTAAVAGCLLYYQVLPEARLHYYDLGMWAFAGVLSIMALVLGALAVAGASAKPEPEREIEGPGDGD